MYQCRSMRGVVSCIMVSLLIIGILVGQIAAQDEDLFYLGVQTHYGQVWEPYGPSLSMVKQANVNCIRDELYWSHIEREDGQKGQLIMPDYYTRYMQRAFEVGVNPLITLGYGNTYYDYVGPGVRANPASDEAIEAFVRYSEFVLRSFPQLKMVEIWNEWALNRPGAGPAQLARLVKAVSQRLKAIRPDLTIVGPNLAETQIDEMLRLVLEEGIMDSVDGISWHPYGPYPDILPFRCERMQAMLREFNDGKDKPMYLTELGWGTSTSFPEHKRALNYAKVLLWARTVPYVKGMWLYNFVDDAGNYGFLKHDLTPKLVYWVIQDLAALIRQGRYLGQLPMAQEWEDGYYIYVHEYQMPDGPKVYPVWHTRKGWGCWLTFKVLSPQEEVVQLLKLGTGTPVDKRLTEEGLFNLYVEGDDIPLLVSGRCEGLQVAGVKWVPLGESDPADQPQVQAKQFTEKPRIDGDLSEWGDLTFTDIGLMSWSDRSIQYQESPEDLSARFAVGWEPETLYVAVEVVDDVHSMLAPRRAFAPVDVDTCEADSVQLAWLLEGDPTNGFFQLGFARTIEGDKTVPYNLPRRMWPDFRQTLQSVRKSIRREAATTTYEIAIPVSPGFLPALAAGGQLRFSFLVIDSDPGEGDPSNARWGWTGGTDSWGGVDRNLNPDLYGIVTFAAQEG